MLTHLTVEEVFYNKQFLKDLINNNDYVQMFWVTYSG